MAGWGVWSAETVPRVFRLGTLGVVPADAEARGPIRVLYRWVLGIAPVLEGTIGVEIESGWKEVAGESASDRRTGGKASGVWISDFRVVYGEGWPTVLKDESDSSELDEKSPASVRGREGSPCVRLSFRSGESGIGWGAGGGVPMTGTFSG